MSIDEHAIGLHIILRNLAGTFPKFLADLSGLEFKENNAYQNVGKPSFHYSRYQNCSYGKKKNEKYFYFTADITLEDSATNEAGKGAVILSLPSLDKTSKKSKTDRKDIKNSINNLLFGNINKGIGYLKSSNCWIYKTKNDRNDQDRDRVKKLLTENCPYHVTFSPETYREKLFNLLEEKNWEFYTHFAKHEAMSEIERAYIDTRFRYDFSNNNRDSITGRPLAKLHI